MLIAVLPEPDGLGHAVRDRLIEGGCAALERRPVEPVQRDDPGIADVDQVRQRTALDRCDRHADGRRSGVGHDVELAPAREWLVQQHSEFVRRVVIFDLAQFGRTRPPALRTPRRAALRS